jgi:hypothetical protein
VVLPFAPCRRQRGRSNSLLRRRTDGIHGNVKTLHVVARSFDDRLLQWSWSSRDQTWRVVSLTDRATKEGPGVGEALVASDPRGASLRVVARGLPPDDRLLQWRWNVPDGWRVRDSFPTAVG